jgi:hypothetical protein
VPETFSSEIGDPQGLDPRDRDSFSTEFRGASDSLIRKDRPEPIGGRGRIGVLLVVLIFLVPVLGFGAFALWYWSESLGNWIAGIGRQTEPATGAEVPVEEAPQEVATEPLAEPPVEKVFGIKGAPDGTAPLPEPEPVQPELPTQPDTPVQPPQPPATKIETVSTNVRGKVGSSTINSRLAKVDAALPTCWANAGAAGPVELVLGFGIKWNGNLQGISLKGGSETLHACVRKALPTSGWPKPSDGGDASVTRTWKLN